jgi:hypothetical protein
MILVLPMRGPDSNGLYLDQRVRVQIGPQYYSFRFRYNPFEDAWYCYVGLLGQDPRVKFKMVVGTDLLLPYKAYDEVPNGFLRIVDMDGRWGRPSKDNMHRDGRFFILFVSEDEDIQAFIASEGNVV